MSRMKICSCGKIIPDTAKCECKIRANNIRNKEKNKNNPEEKKFFNSTRWKKLRAKIIERDEAHCQRCLIKYNLITTTNLQVHHIKSRFNFSDLRWEENNLITLCQTCNTQLGTNDVLDFKSNIKQEERIYFL